MASNYLNSAGTDLDNVFHVDNSNAGALGFLTSDNQDLGNRYPAGSLGVEVGYKTDAGTDIGYLRANIMPVEGTIVYSQDEYFSDSDSDKEACSYGDTSKTCTKSCTIYGYRITANLNISNNMEATSIKWVLEAKKVGSSSYMYANTTGNKMYITADAGCYAFSGIGGVGCNPSCDISGNSTEKNVTADWTELTSVTNTNLSQKFAIGNTSSSSSILFRVKAIITNIAGNNTIYGPES